jgi:uncharacterized OB-fold protein
MPSELPPRPIPIADPETAPFWDGVRAGEILVQRCTACGTHRFYPRALCSSCHDPSHDWVRVAGRGTIYSFTVVRRAPSAGFASLVPYVVAIVALEEGPHLLTRIVGIAPEAVTIGMRVSVQFERLNDTTVLPVFVPLAS